MQRSKRNLAMATAAVVIASTAVSGAALVGAADAAPVTHTLKFVAISDREHAAGHNGFMGTEIERNHGRLVGYDVITGIFNPSTQSVKIYVAITRHGGLLFGRVHSTSQTSYAGRVTGGSGRFAGATGTITAKNAPHNDSRTFVTVHYILP
jgi:hypothetical protein